MPTLNTLPLELRVAILTSLSPPDLLAASSSTRALHCAFKVLEPSLLVAHFDRKYPGALHPLTCGETILHLVNLSQTSPWHPSSLEQLLEHAWPRFKNLSLEEALTPICVAIARTHLAYNARDKALSLLKRVYTRQEPFTLSTPVNLDARLNRSAGRLMTYFELLDQPRAGMYPVAKMLLSLLEGTDDEMLNIGDEVCGQSPGLRAEVKVLEKKFKKGYTLLIGGEGVAQLRMSWMPSKSRAEGARMGEAGVLFKTDCTGSNSNSAAAKWPFFQLQDTVAIMRMTRWSLADYMCVASAGGGDLIGMTTLDMWGPKGTGMPLYRTPPDESENGTTLGALVDRPDDPSNQALLRSLAGILQSGLIGGPAYA
ncbi:uncharacterized protein DSM5745_02690 [Aspergillus mulundensis]|uniref:F-box domain-containing protein n=1 Tax=Aspergillus mulundensis TaxID=1810919 RepID=A0A3D8SJT9_9EURO|nr:hypothetical protein DSM5745_02690 [Aspergillus mulundensis]RDW86048.1 hypothetical protein DSM5745_02690 [Aspergillus mulundensis]